MSPGPHPRRAARGRRTCRQARRPCGGAARVSRSTGPTRARPSCARPANMSCLPREGSAGFTKCKTTWLSRPTTNCPCGEQALRAAMRILSPCSSPVPSATEAAVTPRPRQKSPTTMAPALCAASHCTLSTLPTMALYGQHPYRWLVIIPRPRAARVRRTCLTARRPVSPMTLARRPSRCPWRLADMSHGPTRGEPDNARMTTELRSPRLAVVELREAAGHIPGPVPGAVVEPGGHVSPPVRPSCGRPATPRPTRAA